MPDDHDRRFPDLAAYTERSRNGPCFVCRTISADPDFFHHVVYEDENSIAFLNKYPTQLGYTLVAPKKHREQVTGSFTLEEYLELQKVVYRVAEALKRVVEAERVYLMSLGSNEGNAHVHWHVVPLPANVPYAEQQYAAVMVESAGVLNVPEDDVASLARRIGEGMK